MRLLTVAIFFACASSTQAQPLTVLSSNATRALIEELGPEFEKSTGHTLTLRFDNSAALKTRIEGGEAFDVAVLSASTVAALVEAGRMASPRDIARAGVGMAIHPHGTKPNINTLDELKGALITSRSITYVEQGATATVLRGIFARLGLTELMNAKTVYSESAAHAVAEKKAELGFTQISEILNVPGAAFAAALPAEAQVYTTFQAATSATPPSVAAKFIAFLTATEAAPAIRRSGMELMPPPSRIR